MKTQIIVFLASGILCGAASAAEQTAPFQSPADKFAYSVGMSLGKNLKTLDIKLADKQLQILVQGLKDGMAGQAKLSNADATAALREYQQQAWKKLGEKNLKEAKEFLAKNKTRPGVKEFPSGLQYQVLKEGSGESPSADDTVVVNYQGSLLDGTIFDDSARRGRPARFVVKRVIKGWQEALTHMKPGDKWRIFIPPQLAYGERGRRPLIGPNALLVFEVELVSVERGGKSASRPIVTSPIIKVPSKEEIQKGAKPEIINPSQLKKNLQKSKPAKAKN